MLIKFVLIAFAVLVSGYLGFSYGQRVEAAAWKKVVAAKGLVLDEFTRLRKLL